MRSLAFLVVLVVLVFGSAVVAEELTDAQIRDRVIAESINAYPGNCPCPYNLASNGSRCGKRSAWSRAGGYAPICYPNEVSDEKVRQYRETRQR